jgi:hypothetical protein
VGTLFVNFVNFVASRRGGGFVAFFGARSGGRSIGAMFELVRPHRRRGARRTFRGRCRALRLADCELVGEQILDLSPRGALIACDAQVRVGDDLWIDFRAPWLGPHVATMARVARVVEGWREGDPGYCAGVVFEDETATRAALAERLALFPPTEGARPYPIDYAETVRRIAAPEPPSAPPAVTLVRRSIVTDAARA